MGAGNAGNECGAVKDLDKYPLPRVAMRFAGPKYRRAMKALRRRVRMEIASQFKERGGNNHGNDA